MQRRGRVGATRRAAHGHPSGRCYGRERTGPGRLADRLDDDLDPFSGRLLDGLDDVPGVMVDGEIGAPGACLLELVVASGGDDRAGAEQARVGADLAVDVAAVVKAVEEGATYAGWRFWPRATWPVGGSDDNQMNPLRKDSSSRPAGPR